MPIGVQADFINVAPHIGAWIEIFGSALYMDARFVALYISAWIEIQFLVV
ncbi:MULTISPECIES: hypothetical protein [Bacillus cereus group]|nr:hypothetical protein [Bacillus cereus]